MKISSYVKVTQIKTCYSSPLSNNKLKIRINQDITSRSKLKVFKTLDLVPVPTYKTNALFLLIVSITTKTLLHNFKVLL